MSTVKRTIKLLAGFLVPYSVVALVNSRQRKRSARRADELRATLLEEYRTRLATRRFDYGSAVDFLAKQGLDEHQVRDGSMPEASLAYCMKTLAAELGGAGPLIGVHVGNFVGISLAAFAEGARTLHPGSFVLAVDPNVPHRGIANPQEHVARLLISLGLQDNVLLVCGYTLEKSMSNDGQLLAAYDPQAHFHEECSPENVLPKLHVLCPKSLDFAVIDGNHDPGYLERELREILSTLRPGAVIFVDDVSESWAGVSAVFDQLGRSSAVQLVGQDGRVGIVRLV